MAKKKIGRKKIPMKIVIASTLDSTMMHPTPSEHRFLGGLAVKKKWRKKKSTTQHAVFPFPKR